MQKKLVICLGSSCFARGNNKNLERIERLVADGTLPLDMVEVRGSCCEQMCSDGPNISIDGRMLHNVDAGMLSVVFEEIAGPQHDSGSVSSDPEESAHE